MTTHFCNVVTIIHLYGTTLGAIVFLTLCEFPEDAVGAAYLRCGLCLCVLSGLAVITIKHFKNICRCCLFTLPAIVIIGVYFNLPLPGCLSFATVGFFVVLLATTALDSNGPHWNTVRIQDTEMGEPITSEKVPFSNQATARSDDLVSDLRVSTTKGCLNRSHNEPSGGKPCDAPSLSSRSSAADQVEESRRSAGTRHNIATAYAADTIEDDFGYGPFLRILKLPLDAPADTLLSDSSSIHLSEYIGPLPKHIPYTLDDFERDFNGS